MSVYHVTTPTAVADPDGYCPYCNECLPGKLTEEHYYPKCVGGDDQTFIWVCKTCNSNAGTNVDTLLMRHVPLRWRAIKPSDRHPSNGKLRDGRELEGWFHWIKVKDGARVGFIPKTQQRDGSKWVRAETVRDLSKLPKDINVYRDDMLDSASLEFADPATLGLEPAIAKILLAFVYFVHGKCVTRHKAFDACRNAVHTGNVSDISFNWWATLEALNLTVPFALKTNEWAVWAEANASGFIDGGIAFGKNGGYVTVRSPSHGLQFPGRIVRRNLGGADLRVDPSR